MKYYFVIKDNIPIAYTDSYQQLLNYLRDRKKMNYKLSIEDYENLPLLLQKRINDGDLEDLDIIGLGSFNEVYITLADEQKLIDHLDYEFENLTDRLNLLTKLIDILHFSEAEKAVMIHAMDSLETWKSEFGIGSEHGDLDVIDWLELLKLYMKKGIVN